MLFEPNAPCPCGSGKKYKKCHRVVDEAPSHAKYGLAQGVYADNWKTTSQLQYARGDYAWMADQLKPYAFERVFDIGTGSGHGLLALWECYGPRLRIVGIDENPACLRVASKTLEDRGLPAPVIIRLDITETPFGFVQEGGPLPLPLPEPVALIEADPLTDPYLEDALTDGGLFDVVTIWLTGGHFWRRHNAYSVHRGAKSEHDLRIILQNEAYELADRILRPGGILHVVDRAEAPTSEALRIEYFKAHSEQAEPTSLKVRHIDYRLWEPPEGAPIKLVTTDPENRPDSFPEPQLGLVSIISEKV